MTRQQKNLATLLATGSLTFGAGCSGVQHGIPNFSVDQCAYRESRNNVRIGVEPMDVQPEVFRFFEYDVRMIGYQPTFVAVENTGNNSIVFQPTESSFVDNTGARWAFASGTEMFSDLKLGQGQESNSGYILAFLMSPPGALVGIAIGKAHNDGVKSDYIAKCEPFTRDVSLEPGETVRGFVPLKRTQPYAAAGDWERVYSGGIMTFYFENGGNEEKVEVRLNSPTDINQRVQKR